MITTFETFEHSLQLLSRKLGSSYSESEWLVLIENSLKENNLKGEEPVPAWLVNFIQYFIETSEVESVLFERSNDDTNLERRWLEFINSVVGGEWEYDGESESIAFDQIGMQGIIDHLGKSYYFISY